MGDPVRYASSPTKISDGEMLSEASPTAEAGELKRDLSSRHINMIALAGMIVGTPDDPTFLAAHLTLILGNWPFPQLWAGDCDCWSGRCHSRLSPHGLRNRRSLLHHWRVVSLHASHWRLHQTRK